jgi:BirA family biotin operon repressor/biotin-[acetyl-CoA-carboxylase] ligase
MEIIKLSDISSTNDYLLGLDTGEEVCVRTDYQSAGKGMGTNTWESEAGKNLLFSILVHPVWLSVTEQYLLSMAEALAIHDALTEFLELTMGVETEKKLTIKWPNDIYWEDKKLSGTRIDGNIKGGVLQDFVIGTGINVNQQRFFSDAPNPVSLYQITGKEYDNDEILNKILEHFAKYQDALKQGDKEKVVREYHERLYRRTGIHRYEDGNGTFDAEIVKVNTNGIMTLRRTDGTLSDYEFKEVRFVIS